MLMRLPFFVQLQMIFFSEVWMPAEAMERVSFLTGAIAACLPTCTSNIQVSESQADRPAVL